MTYHMAALSGPRSSRATLAALRAGVPWIFSVHSSAPCSSFDGPGTQDRSHETPSVSSKRHLHTPVMLKEVIRCLNIHPGQLVLDMTFGGGGHTQAILNAAPDVRVLALDRDPTAFSLAQQLAELHTGRVQPVLGRFSELEALLSERGLGPGSVDAVLLDAGCSSMQMDRPERGFSLSRDGPLDMRMDGDRFPALPCAADVVNALDPRGLATLLAAYGEEKHARKIAAAIVEARAVYPITRTQQLASVVAGSFPAAALYARKDQLQRSSHVATKTFQALRVFVNNELNELHAGLRAAQRALKPGGRLCVITFHSLEDRLVKRFLLGDDLSLPHQRSLRQKARRAGREEAEGDEADGGGGVHWAPLERGVIVPQPEEVAENPRGRSAKLRASIRR